MKQIERYKPLFNSLILFNEMALSKKEIETQIIYLTTTLNNHIFKILLFPNEKQLTVKWSKEIYAYLEIIQSKKWKNNNKYLPQDIYFKCLYTKPLDTSDEKNKGDEDLYKYYIKNIIADNDELIAQYNEDTFPFREWNQKVVNLYKEISSLLSKGKVTQSITSTLLEKYI